MTDITLREFIEEKLKRIEADLAHMRELRIEDQKALRLQAEEYERRLENLNHAHEQAQETAHTYVTLEKYEANIQAEHEARGLAEDRMDEKLEERAKTWTAMMRTLEQNINQSIPRLEYQVQHKALEEKVDKNTEAVGELAKLVSNIQGRGAAYMAALGVGLVVMQLVLRFVVK